MTLFENYPIIDPRNEEELVTRANNIVLQKSNGLINDFSENSPVTALNQGLSFIGAEILWYVNKLPEALSLKFLEYSGYDRNVGKKSIVRLRFSLNINPSELFEIPAGFTVNVDSNIVPNRLTFVTLSTLRVLPGNIFGEVDAECTTIGIIGNVPPNSVTIINTPYNYLQSVTNPESGYGGQEPDSEDRAKEKVIDFIRQRNVLITANDFEVFCRNQLGNDSRVVVLPSIGKDGVSRETGSVHVFCLNSDKSLLSNSQISSIESQMSSLVPLGVSAHCSSIVLLPVSLKATITINQDYISSLTDIGTNIYTSLLNYLNPLTYPSNTDNVAINNIEYTIKNTNPLAIFEVVSVLINGIGSDLLIPNTRSLPTLRDLILEVVTTNGYRVTIGYGEGDPD